MSQAAHDAANRLRPLTARHLRARADMLQTEIYGLLEESAVGRGRTYRLRGGRLHQASQPGDPPARLTRRLQNSIQVVHFDDNALVAQVGPNPAAFTKVGPYPAWLEFGTRFMAPRSFMRAGLERFRARLK